MEELYAEIDGFVTHIACDEVGMVSLILGGGRETKESVIDLSVGIVLRKKVGDEVKKGDVLALLHANDEKNLSVAKERLYKSYSFSEKAVEKKPLIKGIIK